MNESQPPVARVELPQPRSFAWVLPVAALALAVFLGIQTWGTPGTRIIVRAEAGHGIEAGDTLRYRGIEVGVIEEARLSSDLGAVVFEVRLGPGSEAIARAGSRFWVVRPRLSLDGVTGLDTVVGARHLSVDPGPVHGRRQTEFLALAEAPVIERLEPGGLELTLEAPRRFGLAPGAPVTYRQSTIGQLLSVGLSSDATRIEMRAWIRPEYVQLVRRGSVFWETGGVELGLSLTGGFRLDVASIRSLLVGGVAMATPPGSADLASTGQRFTLHDKAEDEWKQWSPPLPVGGQLLPPDVVPPRLLRAVHSWKQGRFMERDKSRHGWLLVVPGGVLGPADLLLAQEGARDDSSKLEVGGERFSLDGQVGWSERGLARRSLELPDAAVFDLTRARALTDEVEECLIFGDPTAAPMALAADRLRPGPRGWELDDAFALDTSWNGAAVLARSDGALLGILLVGEEGVRVAGIPMDK
jgi:paraquat-inducible protein B